ncbi:hypothetical protein [Paraburkholderia elongata]|uniref:hypothetical protein n=1 Tax=Paraburkholderia elongata TaxID=2675747 RepID=UPI001F19B817|nr:hypothetical protein [Paraburkholderia elongata]
MSRNTVRRYTYAGTALPAYPERHTSCKIDGFAEKLAGWFGVVIIDGEASSGHSVTGPLDARMSLSDLLQSIAETLRGQLRKTPQ